MIKPYFSDKGQNSKLLLIKRDKLIYKKNK